MILNEETGGPAGYSVVELTRTADSGPRPPENQPTIGELEGQIDNLDAQIESAQAELARTQQQAASAVEGEDPAAAGNAWSEKRKMRARLSELEQTRTDILRQRDAKVAAFWDQIEEERGEVNRLRMEHEAGLQQATDTARQLVGALERLAANHEECLRHLRAWEERLDGLERHGPPTEPSRSGLTSAGPRRSTRPRRPSQGVSKQWSVYDPDAGKLVQTADDLMRLLARWYPSVHEERERVREFLAMPNSEPLPQQLRDELDQRGLLKP